MGENTDRDKPPPQRVTDPVCGMEVTTDSPFAAEHEGTLYFFCREACQRSFASNPDRYIHKDE